MKKKMDPEKAKKMVIEAFQESKKTLIGHGNKLLNRVVQDILEIEADDYGNDPEQVHAVQEGRLVASLFAMHAFAVEKMTDMFCDMITEGVLVPDVEVANKVATKKKKEYLKKMQEEMDDREEGEEWKAGNSGDDESNDE